MANRTSTQSGNLSNSATWGGATFVNGDVAIVSNAAHVVTVDTTITMGAAGAAGTTSMQITGRINIEAPVTWRGDIQLIGSGALRVDRRGALTGSLTHFPTATVVYKMVSSGSGTSRFEVYADTGEVVPIYGNQSLNATGRWYVDFTTNPPLLDLNNGEWKDFGGVGDTSVATRALSYTGLSGSSTTLRGNRFASNVGKILLTMSGLNDCTYVIENNDFRGALDGETIRVLSDTAPVSGTRSIKGNTFGNASVSPSLQFWVVNTVIEDNVIYNSALTFDVWEQDNIVRRNVIISDNALTIIGLLANDGMLGEQNIFLMNRDNPHYWGMSTSSVSSGPTVIRDNIADGFGFIGSDAGDWALGVGPVSVLRNLLINEAGTLFSVLDTTVRFTVEGNTCVRSAGGNAGESVGQALALQRIKHNLFVAQPDGMHQDAPFVSQSALVLNYNGFWQMTNAANLDHPSIVGNPNSYVGPASTAAWFTAGNYGDAGKGANDLYIDPQFADVNASTLSWYLARKGSAGTFALVRDELLKKNGTALDGTAATFDPLMAWVDLWAFLREAYEPQNSALYQAGDPADGSPSIGAITPVPPPPQPQISYPRNVDFRRRVIAMDAA